MDFIALFTILMLAWVFFGIHAYLLAVKERDKKSLLHGAVFKNPNISNYFIAGPLGLIYEILRLKKVN